MKTRPAWKQVTHTQTYVNSCHWNTRKLMFARTCIQEPGQCWYCNDVYYLCECSLTQGILESGHWTVGACHVCVHLWILNLHFGWCGKFYLEQWHHGMERYRGSLPTLNIWLSEKLFYSENFWEKNAKFGLETPILGKSRGKIGILSIHNTSVGNMQLSVETEFVAYVGKL